MRGAVVSSASSASGEGGSKRGDDGWVGVGWMSEEVMASEERGDVGVVVVGGFGRRVSGYSFSKRSIMPSRVESRNWRRPGRTMMMLVRWILDV